MSEELTNEEQSEIEDYENRKSGENERNKQPNKSSRNY